MKIIDAHLHFSNIESFKRTASAISGVDYSQDGLAAEFAASGIAAGIGMGITETSPGAFPDNAAVNPMSLDLELKPKALALCPGINPCSLHGAGVNSVLDRIESVLRDSCTVGIKLYAGYYHFHVHDRVYEPVLALAAKYGLTVVIHSGDTFSDRGLLKYSHPLNVDELAVAHRDVNFVISHLGDPWVLDTAEVVMKNPNVYADLSGLIVGNGERIARYAREPLFTDHLRRALLYIDNYEKVLFGSDWPLAPIGDYIGFVRKLVPEMYHDRVFYSNALKVFPRLGAYIGKG